MNKRGKGKVIIGISMAAIMIVSVLAATMPMVSAESRTDNFNYILKQPAAQKVLIGQNLQFEGFDGTVTISRIVSGDIENVYQADANNRVYNVNWPTSGAYYVNYRSAADYDAQLSVEDPDMPLDLKVGTKKVSSLAVGTNLIIDTGGMNLFPEDQVDLVVIGPDGQIKHDEVNNQQFTDIKVSYLEDHYGSAENTLETSGWTIGDYTFQIETKDDGDNACGLDATSEVKTLKIIKGAVAIEADTTSTVELEIVTLVVTGVADDEIKVFETTKSKYAQFKAGLDDTPAPVPDPYNQFNDTIDSDGVRKYAVEFTDTGTYTIKVEVTGPKEIGGIPNRRVGDYDTVDITVLEKAVNFDLPNSAVIGEKIMIKGTATSGTYVSVYVDDTLYHKLHNITMEDGEFSKEVKTTEVGMDVPGSVRLKAWIDCDKAEGEERPTRSPDGEDAILLSKPTLTAELSVPSVALEDDFTVLGTAKGQTEVTILSVPPKGGGGKSLLDKGVKGLSPRKASVSTTDDTYSKKMTVQEDATAGYYDVYVLCAGMDGKWGMTGEEGLKEALDQKFHISSLTCEGGSAICTKTQGEIDDILTDLVTTPGADDLMQKMRLKVETAYVKLDPVAAVDAGQPLVVKGTSNRQQGYVIVVTCKGPVELAPHTVKVENDTFGCVFDTTDATTGEYIVKADDGDGHVDEVEIFITGKTAQEIEAALKEAAEVAKEVVEEITATPKPTPTCQELIAQKLEEQCSSGQILFNPPKRMQVGVKERVEVRITKNTTKEMRDVLRKGLKGKGDPRIEEIEVGDFMTVILTGDNFVIKSLSSKEQMLRPDKFTQWSWDVTPQKKGKHVLHLIATIRIKFPDQDEEPYDLPTFDEITIVDVNYTYSFKRFIESHLKWIVSTVIAIVAVIVATGFWKKKRREER